jgi:hypothetical protein
VRQTIIGSDTAGINAGGANLNPLCIESSVKTGGEPVRNCGSFRCGTLPRVTSHDGSGAGRGHPAARSPN